MAVAKSILCICTLSIVVETRPCACSDISNNAVDGIVFSAKSSKYICVVPHLLRTIHLVQVYAMKEEALLWHQAVYKACFCSCCLASSVASALSFSLLRSRIRMHAFRPTEVRYCFLHLCTTHVHYRRIMELKSRAEF